MSETMLSDAATTPEGSSASEATATATANAGTAAGGDQQQGAENGAAEAKAGEGSGSNGGEAEGESAQAGAPDRYDFKAAEGQPEFDPKTIEQFSEVAKELNLPQDAAQKVLDKMAPALAARQAEAVEAARTQWAADAKADKEFGGDKLTENLAVAKKALDQLGTPELSKLLNESGLGNHPEVIRVLYRAGKAISEDSRVVTGQGQTGQQSMAQRMYPNMNP